MSGVLEIMVIKHDPVIPFASASITVTIRDEVTRKSYDVFIEPEQFDNPEELGRFLKRFYDGKIRTPPEERKPMEQAYLNWKRSLPVVTYVLHLEE